MTTKGKQARVSHTYPYLYITIDNDKAIELSAEDKGRSFRRLQAFDPME